MPTVPTMDARKLFGTGNTCRRSQSIPEWKDLDSRRKMSEQATPMVQPQAPNDATAGQPGPGVPAGAPPPAPPAYPSGPPALQPPPGHAPGMGAYPGGSLQHAHGAAPPRVSYPPPYGYAVPGHAPPAPMHGQPGSYPPPYGYHPGPPGGGGGGGAQPLHQLPPQAFPSQQPSAKAPLPSAPAPPPAPPPLPASQPDLSKPRGPVDSVRDGVGGNGNETGAPASRPNGPAAEQGSLKTGRSSAPSNVPSSDVVMQGEKSGADADAELQDSDTNPSPTDNVEPMRQDFHFYVDDKKDTLLAEARRAVREALKDKVEGKGYSELDSFLVMSRLNQLLMSSWDSEAATARRQYMEKEEADRKRFQADDEVASRHCATLTARSRSPKTARRNLGLEPIQAAEKSAEAQAQTKRPAAEVVADAVNIKDEDTEADSNPAKKSRAAEQGVST